MRLIIVCLAALTALLLCVACVDEDPGQTAPDTANSPAAEKKTEQASTPAETSGEVAAELEDAAAEAATEADQTEPDAVEGEAVTETEDEEPADEEEPAAAEDGTTRVVLETTVGDITVEVHPEWAPHGAKQFLMLIREGYFDGAPFFRVVPDFMAQAGFSGDHALTAKYLGNGIPDDPVVMGNLKYTLSFGNTGTPGSRSSHIFINFKDNNMLDTQRVPFPAFAKVIAGFDAVDKIHRTGEMPGQVQQKMREAGGVEWFIEQYPDATVITSAYIVE